jgi:FtsZ-interacting cell division protein ZipA
MQASDIIVLVIGLIVVVGGWLFNALKRPQEQGQAGLDQSGGGSGNSRQRMDELAARRRQQLQELARQRREELGTQPTNLTMAEAAERAEARTVYERRAEALRRMRQQEAAAGGARLGEGPSPQAQAQAQQQRARELARQRAEQEARQRTLQRQQETERQRELARVRQRQQAQRLQQQQREQQQRQEQLRRSAQQRAQQLPEAAIVLEEVVASQRPSAYAQQPRSGGALVPILGNISLRQAIILKEILDPPVGLRQDGDPHAMP